MSVTLDCKSEQYDEKKIHLFSERFDCNREKCKRHCGGTYGAVWRSLCVTCLKSGVRRSIYVGAFHINTASVAVKMFTHLIYLKINVTSFNFECYLHR
jgi:hypothetical protein